MAAYGRQIADINLPVVNAGTRESPTYLPAEVCVVMSGQAAKTKLSPAQTQEMIRFAVRKPWENANWIVKDGIPTTGLSSQTNPLLVSVIIATGLLIASRYGGLGLGAGG